MDTETASAVPRSAVSATITARQHGIVQDKPSASGGSDEGPMASELLLAALLACQLSTFAKVAPKRRLDHVRAVRIDGAMHFEDGDIRDIDLDWHLAGEATDEQLTTLTRLTEKACTISKALRVPVSVRVHRV